jgi:hypothetical protein
MGAAVGTLIKANPMERLNRRAYRDLGADPFEEKAPTPWEAVSSTVKRTTNTLAASNSAEIKEEYNRSMTKPRRLSTQLGLKV